MLNKCIFCGKMPRIIHYDKNMWYVECDCGNHPKYEYLGFTQQGAEERWEYANRPINRTPPKRKENESKGAKKNRKSSD